MPTSLPATIAERRTLVEERVAISELATVAVFVAVLALVMIAVMVINPLHAFDLRPIAVDPSFLPLYAP